MCGMTGIVSLDRRPVTASMIKAMNDSLYHRGPDDEGTWNSLDNCVHLGLRRLAIIDLSEHGHQPMQIDNGDFVIAHNGEIYNFQEIREHLEKRGHAFFSNTDTEVILRNYIENGFRCVDDLNGMWAFAIFDKKKNSLFISRDRIGMKPLYYTVCQGKLIFASEIKAIIASGLYRASVDPEGLNEYFTFQNIISHRTLFKDVSMLKAGNNLHVDLSTGQVREEKYWDMEYRPDESITEDEITRELLARFGSSMQRHLRSDVEIGATISGGMDSSAIVAIASKYIRNLNTFTGFFDTSNIEADDRCVNEKDYARMIAQKFGTKHHERQIFPQDVIDTLPPIVWHLEDPKVGMCYTFYNMSQLVGSHVTVNLSGTGGDELFAGYPWRYSLVDSIQDPESFNEKYFAWWCRLIPPSGKRGFFTDSLMKNINIQTPWNEYLDLIAPARAFTPLNRALYFDFKTFLHGFVLVEDKTGMAFSIESRFPFLDKELLDLLSVTPDKFKYKDGVSKYIVRKALAPLLPDEIVHKRKQGFTPPDMTWYRRELSDYIETLLLGRRALSSEYISRDAVSKIISRHKNGEDLRLLLWSLMYFEGWCRTFLAQSNASRPVFF